jgi:hypothetical protein
MARPIKVVTAEKGVRMISLGHSRTDVFRSSGAFASEGRKPSAQAIVAEIGEDEELAPGHTVRQELFPMVSEAIHGALAPVQDAIETLIDLRARERLSGIGATLSASIAGSGGVIDLAADTIVQLDDVVASLKGPTRQTYSAASAAAKAIERLDGKLPVWPTTGFADLDLTLSEILVRARKHAAVLHCEKKKLSGIMAEFGLVEDMVRMALGVHWCTGSFAHSEALIEALGF